MGMRRDFPPSGNGDDAPRLVVFEVINLQPMKGGSPMEKVIREGAIRVGVDLAKRVIQVHGVDAAGRVLTSKAVRRDKFIEWCVLRLPGGCVVAMEASSRAPHWARKLQVLGLEPRIIAAQLVEPCRSQGASGKNDANDAAAICEAASRPTMRFIPVKSIEQQSMLCVHRLREGIKEDRTACINRIRGLLAEFGLVFPQGASELQGVLGDVLEDATNELGTLARLTLQRAQGQWRELDEHLAWCDERIAAHGQANAAVKAFRIRAQRKVLNPSIGRVMRLMARWSCSTTLLRYFDWRISMGSALSAWMLVIAAVFAPFLSIVTFSGTPCRSVACSKTARAAACSRLARSRKSTVSPSRSTAR